jgi:hypothetical protein
MFAGSFLEPRKYRACIRAAGRPLPCSDGTAYHLIMMQRAPTRGGGDLEGRQG